MPASQGIKRLMILEPGDPILMRSIKSVGFDTEGRFVAEVTFKAPRGRAFLFVFLGAVNPAEHSDTEPLLNKLGWHFCEVCQAGAAHPFLRRLVDLAWQAALEDETVPSTEWEDRLIAQARATP